MNRRQFLKISLSTLLALNCIPFNSKGLAVASNGSKIPRKNKWLPRIDSDEFGFLAIGDMGTGWKTQKDLIALMSTLPANQFPAVLLLGDIIYPAAKADLLESNLIQPFEPMLKAGNIFYPCWGNHDWLEKEAIHLKQYFDAPDYYSFSIGPADFWALNSNKFDSAQANWLSNSLANSKSTWKIVFLHHSPYSSGKVHHTNKNMIQHVCPILNDYKVDLCLSGHNHLYERTEKIGNVTYIVSGGGSASLHSYEETVDFPRAYIDNIHHFIAVQGNSHNLSLKAFNLKGQAFDQLRLIK